MSTGTNERKQTLLKVREAIHRYSFSPLELSTPSEIDVIMMLLAVDEFPVKMPFTKLAIICFVGSRGEVTRQQINRIMRKHCTTITHAANDLVEQGYITQWSEHIGKKGTRAKVCMLTPEGEKLFTQFVDFYQSKIIELQELNQDVKDN